MTYSRKKRNWWYDIAQPLFDNEFCDKYNKEVVAKKKNCDRQEFLAVSRIANGLSWSQTQNINYQVCL